MTTKELHAQYLDGLEDMFAKHIFDNVASFKQELLSEGVTNVMEVWYNSSGALAFCEFEESTTIYEFVDVDELVHWIDKLDEPDVGGTAA